MAATASSAHYSPCSSSAEDEAPPSPLPEEASYDTPWEFTARFQRSPSSVSGGGSHNLQQQPPHYGEQPACGVAARRIKQSSSSTELLTAAIRRAATDDGLPGVGVWHYRGPETDGRPPSEYDAPWDSKVRERLRLKGSVSAEPPPMRHHQHSNGHLPCSSSPSPSSCTEPPGSQQSTLTNKHNNASTLSSRERQAAADERLSPAPAAAALTPSNGDVRSPPATTTVRERVGLFSKERPAASLANGELSPGLATVAKVQERVGVSSSSARERQSKSQSAVVMLANNNDPDPSASPQLTRCWPLRHHNHQRKQQPQQPKQKRHGSVEVCQQRRQPPPVAVRNGAPTSSTDGSSGTGSGGGGTGKMSSADVSRDGVCEARRALTPVCVTPRMETAFCCTTPVDTTPIDASAHEQKMKLIQQVCAVTGTTTTADGGANKKRLRKPPRITAKPDPRHPHTPHSPGVGAPLAVINCVAQHKPSPREVSQNDQPPKNGRDDSQTTAREEEYDIPWEFCNKKKITRLIEQRRHAKKPDGRQTPPVLAVKSDCPPEHSSRHPPAPATKPCTSAPPPGADGCPPGPFGIPKLDLMKLNRQQLSLNFGCAGLNPAAEKFDVTVPLEKQPWFHGNILRNEAELRLENSAEGSFLVRLCESNKGESALSLKSAKGFMHMKIQWSVEKGGWILGYFSQPFDSVPRMVRYYSINKLPIKGAEHMCLLTPVNDHLL